MADVNFEAQRLAELLAQANDELARYGKVRQQTQDEITDAEMKAKYGIENFTKGTAKAAESITALAGAAFGAGKAMYDGKKGAAAFNDSLDDMSKAATAAGVALTLLVPGGIVIKGVIAGLTAVATASIAYTKAANEMADKQYKAFSGLQKSGAAAADGMGGVYRDAKKLGLSMNELDSMVALVAESSTDLAQFTGSVSDGRKRLADMGQSLEANRAGFLKMGLSMQDVNEGMVGYLRTVQRTGAAQKMTNDQLAASARNYIYEQDVLAKITGMSAKKQQEATERALQEEQFLAKIRQLEMAGETQKANELKKLNIMYSAQGEQVGAGFRALVNGNQRNADAQMVFRSSYGKVQEGINDVLAGTGKAAGAFKKGADGFKQYVDGPGQQLAQLGASEGSFVKFSESVRMANAAGMDMAEAERKAEADLEARGAKGGKAQDAATEAMGNTIAKQISANKAMEDFVNQGVVPAIKAMEKLASATMAAGEAISGHGSMFGAMLRGIMRFLGLVEDKTQVERRSGAEMSQQGEGTTNEQGMDFAQFAEGGIAKGPETGYLVELHGEEAVIPMNKMGGGKVNDLDAIFGGSMGVGYDKLKKYNEEVLKDVEKMAKVTDADTKRTERYSLTYKRILDLKEELFNEEIEDLEAQKELRETIANAGGGLLSGFFGNKSAMRGGNTPNMASGATAGGAGRPSSAAAMPGVGNNMSSMGGAQGIKGPETHEAVGSGGQGLKSSAPKLDTIRSKSGKSTQVNAEYAPKFQALIDYLDSVGYDISSLGGYVDRDVRGKPGVKSVHAHGGAIDINPGANPMGSQLITDMPENISAIANQLGLGWGGNWTSVKDAMHFSVAAHEGGRVKLSEGGVAVGPNSGYPATLHGEEAVIPLNNSGGNFIKMFETMAEGNSRMVAMLDELVRVQRNSNDIQTKMLRTAQN